MYKKLHSVEMKLFCSTSFVLQKDSINFAHSHEMFECYEQKKIFICGFLVFLRYQESYLHGTNNYCSKSNHYVTYLVMIKLNRYVKY